MDRTTLYAPDGRTVETSVQAEVTRLQLAGYSTTPPEALKVADEPAPFDPAEHTVDQVLTFIEEHPDSADAVLELERHGKNRSSLIGS